MFAAVTSVWWPTAANQKIIIIKINKNWKNEKNIQRKNPQNCHGLWVPNLIKRFFSSKRKKKNCHGPWVPNLILSYQALYNEIGFFFGSFVKTFPLEIVELIEEITKNIRTWGCGTSLFRVMKRGHTFLFSTGQIFCQKLLYHIVAMIELKSFRIVTHCCAASFSIKTRFCKNNIFYNLENRIWDKTK